MKTLLVAGCLLWMALAAELAWPDLLAHGALLLPIVCGVMFWTRTTAGLVVSGLALLLDWIARPSQLPLCPMLLPFIAVVFLAPSSHNVEYRARGFQVRVPATLQLPLLTVLAVIVQTLGSVSWNAFPALSPALSEIVVSMKSLTMIALPVSAGLSLLIRIADEFGMRRSIV